MASEAQIALLPVLPVPPVIKNFLSIACDFIVMSSCSAVQSQ